MPIIRGATISIMRDILQKAHSPNAKPESGSLRLDGGLVRHGHHGQRDVVLDADGVGGTGLSRHTLEQDVLALLLGLALLGSVRLDTVQELLTALGVLDVLHTQIDALLQVSAVDDLVADDTDTARGDVVDDAGLAVVVCGRSEARASERSDS